MDSEGVSNMNEFKIVPLNYDRDWLQQFNERYGYAFTTSDVIIDPLKVYLLRNLLAYFNTVIVEKNVLELREIV